MKRFAFAIILLFASASFAAENLPSKVMGHNQYSIKANGTVVGHADVEIRKDGANYITKSEVTIKVGDVINIVNEYIAENSDYIPVRYNSISTVINGFRVTQIMTSARFSDDGKMAYVTDGKSDREMKFDKPFACGTNLFLSKMIAAGFAAGTEVSGLIYDPSIDDESLIPYIERVIGREKISIDDDEIELIHTKQKFGKIKEIDNYFDRNGLLVKSTITMMNNTIEMVLSDN